MEAGAWASYPITAAGANENDLYLSYAVGPIGITVTDYYFPGDTSIVKFGNYADDGKAYHNLDIYLPKINKPSYPVARKA